ncbi:hypothetical protein SNE25_04655 [Mucilaginibacter sabulilitoris]|uniref:Uncharacterized protein n=1 Tax=Mucilaginibacter sabulilitoris TaxID=1173583 RepID=A0ABZ0TNU0_9SPHI|nr:hypothetical protein [Mucilaginibacter sabulilitoris]WPU94811.1 hypothetical protein SNE25_04655 [Mucilaginibacter sabulilitoris]
MKPENRILQAFRTWDSQKAEFLPLLKVGTTDERTILRLQLDHFRQARHHLGDTVRPDEKPFMVLLENNIAKLEKQIYPNILLRLFLRAKNYLIDGPAYLEHQRRQRTANLENLKNQLSASGLGSIVGRLEQHLDVGRNQVQLPLDCHLTAHKRFSLDLHFERDVYGNFELRRIDGLLAEKSLTTREHKFDMAEWPDLKSNHVLSLLEGRAIKQQFIDVLGHKSERWVELGENGVKYYSPDHPFDVAAALATMPNITRNREELIRYLENGQLIPTHWKQDGHFQNIYVQADPGNGMIKIYNSRQRPITAEQLNRIASQLHVKKPQIVMQAARKVIKNGQNVT